MHAVVNSTAELLQPSFAISVARFSGWCFMMPSLSQFKKLERYAEKSGFSAIKIFPAPEKKFRGMCETSLTHLSIGQQDILFHTLLGKASSPAAETDDLFSTPFSLSGGLPRPSPEASFLYLPSLNLPAQPPS
jgi:hypothetical protein